MRTLLWIAAGLLLGACSTMPPEDRAFETGAGADAPRVIGNILRHEGPPPPSPAIVREFLERPAPPGRSLIFERLGAPGPDGARRTAAGAAARRGAP